MGGQRDDHVLAPRTALQRRAASDEPPGPRSTGASTFPVHVLHHRSGWLLGPRYGRGVADETPEEALKNAFGWCQYDGHGPGDELLGDSLTTLELGPGRGNAVAALATKGIAATGVDISPVQIEKAQDQWGHLPNAHFVHADVLDFLAIARQQWDAVYSIWGAVWFTDPAALLPAVLERLAPGGRFVFSHAPHVPDTVRRGLYRLPASNGSLELRA